MEDRTDGLVLKLIEAAVYSGAYLSLARIAPDSRRGLMILADKHHRRVGALCDELCAAPAEGPARTQL